MGYVEKILDKTLGKYGEKHGGFDPYIMFRTSTEEIWKRVCQIIISERRIVSLSKESDEKETYYIIYYRSFPIQDLENEGEYCREIFKDFLPYREYSTMEHIGIKQKMQILKL